MPKVNSTIIEKSKLWHNWHGHISYLSLKQLCVIRRVKRLLYIEVISIEVCKTCATSYQYRKKFSKYSINRSKKVLQLIYANLVGSIFKPSLNGKKYFIVFIDNYSKRN